MLPSEFGGPLKDNGRARQLGGHQANDRAQTATAILRMGAQCGIRPTHKHHGPFMDRSGLAPPIIRAEQRAPGRLCRASEIFQGAVTLPILNSLDQIINAVNVDDPKATEIGGEARQTSTDVRTGRCGQPTKPTQFALANLQLLIA